MGSDSGRRTLDHIVGQADMPESASERVTFSTEEEPAFVMSEPEPPRFELKIEEYIYMGKAKAASGICSEFGIGAISQSAL
jgi:hypothetical protein